MLGLPGALTCHTGPGCVTFSGPPVGLAKCGEERGRMLALSGVTEGGRGREPRARP